MLKKLLYPMINDDVQSFIRVFIELLRYFNHFETYLWLGIKKKWIIKNMTVLKDLRSATIFAISVSTIEVQEKITIWGIPYHNKIDVEYP